MKKITLITLLLLASIACIGQPLAEDNGFIQTRHAGPKPPFTDKVRMGAYDKKMFSSGTLYWDYTPYYPPPVGKWFDLVAIERAKNPQISLCMPPIIVIGDIVKFDHRFYVVTAIQK